MNDDDDSKAIGVTQHAIANYEPEPSVARIADWITHFRLLLRSPLSQKPLFHSIQFIPPENKKFPRALETMKAMGPDTFVCSDI